jgi:hypothetical protein
MVEDEGLAVGGGDPESEALDRVVVYYLIAALGGGEPLDDDVREPHR